MGQLDVEGTEDKMGTIGHEGMIQRKEEDQTISDTNKDTSKEIPFGKKLQATKGQGSQLPVDVKDNMAIDFGADFNSVKVHTGTQAEEMNNSIGAQAFTHQNDIYFNANKFDPSSNPGKFLLAHELTHTIQQGAVPVQQPITKELQKDVKTGNTPTSVSEQKTPSAFETFISNKATLKNKSTKVEKKQPNETKETAGIDDEQKDQLTTPVTEVSVKQPTPKTGDSNDLTENKNADQNNPPKSTDNAVTNPASVLDVTSDTGDTKNADTEQDSKDASVKQPVTNAEESNNLTENKNADQHNPSKSTDNAVTNTASVLDVTSGTGETKNIGGTASDVSGLPGTNPNNADAKKDNINEVNATTNATPTVIANESVTATDEKSDVKSEQLPTDQSDKEIVTPVAKEAIDIHKEISAFKQRTSWYKSNASAMINGHISEIRSNANQQVQKVNTSASNNSKWISNSYDSTLKKIEKQRKETVHEILESKKKEKASIRESKKEQLLALDRGTWKRVKTLRSDGEKIVKSAKDNGVKQIKEIDDCYTDAYTTVADYIDNRVKHHHVTDRKVRMVIRLTGIGAGGLEQIKEVTDELKEKVNEQTSELVERIREEYNTAADALPEEKENIRQAIIDAADAALEGIDAIDVNTAIKQLNEDIQRLRDKLLKEKAEVLHAIEDTRKQSIKEIRHEESIRIADFKSQLADYIAGVDQVRQEVKEEIADKPDILIKELLDLAIKKLDGSHHHLRVDTKRGKNRLIAAFNEASRKTILFYYKTKTNVFDQNSATISELNVKLPAFAKKITFEYQKISKEAGKRMVRATDDYLDQLDHTVKAVISRLTKEKNAAVKELNASVSEVLGDSNKILKETLLIMMIEAHQIATEWDAAFYVRITQEGLANLLLTLLKLAGWALLAIAGLVLLILLIVVLVVTGVLDALGVVVITLIRILVPNLIRWILRGLAKVGVWLLRGFLRGLVSFFSKQIGKWILKGLLAWGLYEGFKSIWGGFTQLDKSPAARRKMMFDGVVLVGTSVLSEWNAIKAIFRLRGSYKSFKALSLLLGDAKIAKDLVNLAKGDMMLATRIAKSMQADDLRVIMVYLKDAADLEKALKLVQNDGRMLLHLITQVDDFKQLVILLEKSGGNGAMLQRFLPRMNSADELIVLFDRVGNPSKVEKLLEVSMDINNISDDALNSMLQMSDDELKALEGKSVDEIEEITSQKNENWLEYHEEGVPGKQKFGHTVEKHVGTGNQLVDDQKIIQRIEDAINTGQYAPSRSSYFKNMTEAERHISDAINSNRANIQSWMRDPNSFKADFILESTDVGRGISKRDYLLAIQNGQDPSIYIQNYNNISVVLRKRPDGKVYYILTSYPTNVGARPFTKY
ncbi:MAG: eCIS core domain-containing protein [Fluviicola sp.]